MHKVTMGVVLFWAGLGSAMADSMPGCVNSPEGPTLMLALLGAAAAVVRHRRNRGSKASTAAEPVA